MRLSFLLLAGVLLPLLSLGQKWDESLNTAKDVPYLSANERALIFEINKARSNPKRYAEEVIAPMKLRFTHEEQKKAFAKDDGTWVLTTEGVPAIDECLKILRKMPSLPLVAPSNGMSKAALLHVKEQGPKGGTGHESKNGAKPWDRMNQFGSWQESCGENIDYGNDDPAQILISLLVDDGVPTRGHRENLLSPKFRKVGVSIGSHKVYKFMCVIDFAGDYRDK